MNETEPAEPGEPANVEKNAGDLESHGSQKTVVSKGDSGSKDQAAALWQQMTAKNEKKDASLPSIVILLICVTLVVLFAGLWVVVFQ